MICTKDGFRALPIEISDDLWQYEYRELLLKAKMELRRSTIIHTESGWDIERLQEDIEKLELYADSCDEHPADYQG